MVIILPNRFAAILCVLLFVTVVFVTWNILLVRMFFKLYTPFTLKTGQFNSLVSTYIQEINIRSQYQIYTISQNLDLVFGVLEGKVTCLVFSGTERKCAGCPKWSKEKPHWSINLGMFTICLVQFFPIPGTFRNMQTKTKTKIDTHTHTPHTL